ncbi:hypothetical protein D3C77_534790 [compost metagenome]
MLLHLEDASINSVEQLVTLLRVKLAGVETIFGSEFMLNLFQLPQVVSCRDNTLGGLSGPVGVLGFLLLRWPHLAVGQAPGCFDRIAVVTSVDLADINTRHGGILAVHVEHRCQLALGCISPGADGQLTDVLLPGHLQALLR